MADESINASDPVVLSTINHIKASAFEKRVSPNLNLLLKLIIAIVDKPSRYDEIAPQMRQIFPCDSALDFLRNVLTTEMKAPPSPPEERDSDDNSRKKTRSWTTSEDYRLIMGVHLYGENNWSEVSEFVGGGRTRSQCSQRWCRVIDPKISKEHWTTEEEKKLLQLVKKYGDKSWIKVAQEMNGRSDVQCRYKYKKLSSQHDNSSDSFGTAPAYQKYKQDAKKTKAQKASHRLIEPFYTDVMQFNYNQFFVPNPYMDQQFTTGQEVPKVQVNTPNAKPANNTHLESEHFSAPFNFDTEKSIFSAESIFNIGALDL
jgi:hypothetical protein